MDHSHRSKPSIKYRNETDKSFGVAGMALGLAVLDVSRLSRGVNLDASGFDTMLLSPDFFSTSHPHMTAKVSWKYNYNHFQVLMGLSIANALSRRLLYEYSNVDNNLRRLLLDASCREGMIVCQLEPEEVEPLFNKYFRHLQQVFANRSIAAAVSELARTMRQQRRMDCNEIDNIFRELL